MIVRQDISELKNRLGRLLDAFPLKITSDHLGLDFGLGLGRKRKASDHSW